MKEVKKGDIVGRISYGKDIIFIVKEIIKNRNNDIAILCGLFERIKADSNVSDLEILDVKKIRNEMDNQENKFLSRIEEIKKYDSNLKEIEDEGIRKSEKIVTGKILHLDGDRRYSEKSNRYYKKLGLKAVVKNIPEYQQPKVVFRLLNMYKPDILVITGHDGMIKKGIKYNDIYNYRNSKYFIETVKEARVYDNKELVIFAGACQSYFEALIVAGANFASSPGRVLIDFIDPILVAQKVAITEENKYITMDDIAYELKEGKNSINGIGANGKLRIE